MSDVDAIRSMASEHDLEFVDLDTYGVDPAAGEILPAQVARRHHVVAVKRKFGTPVIATSDPDDLYAQDSVRASIGRDFISVVASPEQIGERLDRLFGAETEGGTPDDAVDDSLSAPTSEQDDAGIAGSVVDGLWPRVSTDDEPLFASLDESGGNGYAEEAPAADRAANGSGHKGKRADRKARAESRSDEVVEPVDERDWQDFAVEPQ